MKNTWIILLFVLTCLSCNYEREKVDFFNLESENEKQLRQIKEQKLNKPSLKGFMLNSKRPYLYKGTNQYTKSISIEASVAELPGIINLKFDTDSTIRIISFIHKQSRNYENEQFKSFVELINENYQIELSHQNYFNEFVKDSVIYSIDKDYKKELIDNKIEVMKLNREIKALEKERSKRPMVKTKYDDLTEEISLLEFKKYDRFDVFKFEIKCQIYIERKESEKIIEFIESKSSSIKYRINSNNETKDKRLNDF